jgi:hypothetical protein
MKINRIPTKQLAAIKAKLETVREKTESKPAKGSETGSLYYQHINIEFNKRMHK